MRAKQDPDADNSRVASSSTHTTVRGDVLDSTHAAAL